MLNFSDFNNLYVIAVGLSMAYVYVSKPDEVTFLRILKNMSKRLAELVLQKKAKPQEKDEAILTEIQYLLNSVTLNSDIKAKLSVIDEQAKTTLTRIRDIESGLNIKLDIQTRGNFLNIISCDCFLYGMLILFMSDIYKVMNIQEDIIAGIGLIVIFILAIHCQIFDRISKSKSAQNGFRPRILTHAGIVFLISIIIYLFFDGFVLLFPSENKSLHNAIVVSSVFACYIGFILYFCSSFIGCTYQCLVFSYKIHNIHFDSIIDVHQGSLKKIESEIKEEVEKVKTKVISADNVQISSSETTEK